MATDRSEGWDAIAGTFMAARSDIGASLVQTWAREHLPRSSSVVDIGCGSGVPIARALIDEGFEVFGIDASPTLLDAFRRRFPGARTACEAAQDSRFFGQTFAGALAIGLLFLLGADDQREIIHRVANALKPQGRFLFNAPAQACEWRDLQTGRLSRSLGKEAYERHLETSGLRLVDCYHDEGGNHYFDAVKPAV